MQTQNRDEVVHTPAEHATWRSFYSEFFAHMRRHQNVLHPVYADHLHVLHDFSSRIPTLAEIKHILAPFGWTARYVEGYAPPWKIARLLAHQVMPISRSVRSPEELYFANEPDLIHDIFGHLPSLLSAEYRRLLLEWARVAMLESVTELDRTHYHLNKVIVQARDHVPPQNFGQLESASQALAAFSRAQPSRLLTQDKIYFWIFEFGMVETHGQRQIFGAGILSSLAELSKIAKEPVVTVPLTTDSFQAHYNISSEQEAYLVVPHLSTYFDFLESVFKPNRNLAAKSLEREGASYAHG